ncbi:hypothetical protein CF326_g3934 [Tilletia indica]|nr:hypothetical protein CF326_g3934 [Tilletia indica]
MASEAKPTVVLQDPTPTSSSSLAAATRAAAASHAPNSVKAAQDDFPTRFHAVNQERQRKRRALHKRGPIAVVQHAIWKGSYTIGTHTALVMLEPWEVLLVLVITSLFVGAVTFYIAYRLPDHSQLAAERAAYYLFGTRSASLVAAS